MTSTYANSQYWLELWCDRVLPTKSALANVLAMTKHVVEKLDWTTYAWADGSTRSYEEGATPWSYVVY